MKWYLGKTDGKHMFHDMMWFYEVQEGSKVNIARDYKGVPYDFDIIYGDDMNGVIRDYNEGSVVMTKLMGD